MFLPGTWLVVAGLATCLASLISAAAGAALQTQALPYTGTTTRVQTSLPIITFGNEWYGGIPDQDGTL